MRVIQIPLRYANAYLVIDQQAILVDAGFPGDADAIERAITRAGLAPRDITLLVHTHGHIFTPGHTKGSLSLVLGNGEAIVGDVMMGGWMGGALRPQHPNYHYFVDDWDDVHHSIARLLTYAPSRWYVGHGGPLAYARVAHYFASPA